jgi:SAM-dependent methyltransferase
MIDRVLTRLVSSLQRDGFRATVSLCAKNVTNEWRWYLDRKFDRRFGTDTSGRIEIASLSTVGTNREDGVYYESTPTAIFTFIMRHIPLKHDEFVFVDLGSGKGRTLLLASDYPFRNVIGVEFAKELHDIARRNIAVYHERMRRNTCVTRSLCMDAAEFDFPNDPFLLFLYNPFWEPVVQKVLQNLERSLMTNPRKVVVVYYNPLSSKVFEQRTLFTTSRILKLPHAWSREVQRSVRIYSNF